MLRWVALFGLCACTGKAANAVRPGDPSYAKTMGEKCTAGDASPQPLVIDMKAEDRTDLEVAMRRGVVVVAYDCNRLQVLPDCMVAGGYGFVAVTPKTQQLRLTNKDEIKANLPAGVIAASATVQRGAALDVELSIIGKQMASVGTVDASLLRGRCAGATHFVRAVTTGAFSLATHTEGAVDGRVGVKGAGAQTQGSSDKQIEQHDGDPAACASATAASAVPPRGCATPLRLDLVGIGAFGAQQQGTGEDAALTSASADVGGCPVGLTWYDGACRSTDGRKAAPQCRSAEGVRDCQQMCEAGEMAACTNLGVAHLEGRYVELDRARALALFERACAADASSAACYNLGGMLLVGSNGVPADPKRGLQLAVASCYAEPKYCSNAAIAYRDGLGTTKNPARATELFSRGCIGGKPGDCWDLSLAYENGRGVPADSRRAAELERASCSGGFLHACSSVAARYMFGKTVKRDDSLAVQYARLACEKGQSALGCSILGYLTIYGRGGLVKNERGGLELMYSACESDPKGNACEIVGETLRTLGYEQDAKAYLRRACEHGISSACSRIDVH